LVNAPAEYGGAVLRSAPGFDNRAITTALNDTLVEVIGDTPVEADQVLWLNVRLPNGTEGWMLHKTIAIATPVPNW
jgi:hypothetical protein